MAGTTRKTGTKQARRGNPGIAEAGKKTRFGKNDPSTGKRDERINRNGRPRTSDALKKMVLDMFEEEVSNESGEKATILRAMLLTMALRGTPADRTELLNRSFGKVKDEIVFSTDDIKKIIDFLPPDFVDRLARGEDLGDVIIAFITSHSDGKAKAA